MSVFDRFRDAAVGRVKEVSESALRALRKTTLRAQIAHREAAVREAYAAIGAAVFARVEAGEPAPPGTEEHVEAVRQDRMVAIALRAELEALEALDRPTAGTCRTCGTPAEPGQRFCIRCGSALPADAPAPAAPAPAPEAAEPRCAVCGTAGAPGQRFCAQCGKPLAPAAGAGGA